MDNCRFLSRLEDNKHLVGVSSDKDYKGSLRRAVVMMATCLFSELRKLLRFETNCEHTSFQVGSREPSESLINRGGHKIHFNI